MNTKTTPTSTPTTALTTNKSKRRSQDEQSERQDISKGDLVRIKKKNTESGDIIPKGAVGEVVDILSSSHQTGNLYFVDFSDHGAWVGLSRNEFMPYVPSAKTKAKDEAEAKAATLPPEMPPEVENPKPMSPTGSSARKR